jgi:predicted DNA-binding protein with PD1-like motif
MFKMSRLHICHISKDQDVMKAMHDYLMDKDWKGASIVAAVGSIYDVTLGNPGSYDLKVLHKKKIEAPCEVVSFIGEVTLKDNAPKNLPEAIWKASTSNYIVHVHMSCSHGEDCAVNGGSLREALVLRSLNVFMLEHE